MSSDQPVTKDRQLLNQVRDCLIEAIQIRHDPDGNVVLPSDKMIQASLAFLKHVGESGKDANATSLKSRIDGIRATMRPKLIEAAPVSEVVQSVEQLTLTQLDLTEAVDDDSD